MQAGVVFCPPLCFSRFSCLCCRMLEFVARQAWFDRDKSVSAKKRVVKAGIEKVIHTLQEVQKECSSTLQTCKDKFASVRGNMCQNELTVLESRISALELVLVEAADEAQKQEVQAKLRQFIQSFACALGEGARTPGPPPCKSYGKLFLASELWQLLTKCDEAESRQDLESVSKELVAEKATA